MHLICTNHIHTWKKKGKQQKEKCSADTDNLVRKPRKGSFKGNKIIARINFCLFVFINKNSEFLVDLKLFIVAAECSCEANIRNGDTSQKSLNQTTYPVQPSLQDSNNLCS